MVVCFSVIFNLDKSIHEWGIRRCLFSVIVWSLLILFLILSRKKQGKKETTWRIFSLKELQLATNNFNYDNKLGEGGFGSVYWGQSWDGSQVRWSCFASYLIVVIFRLFALLYWTSSVYSILKWYRMLE